MWLEGMLHKPYCVYGHFIGTDLFYIGCGRIARAFEDADGLRNEEWHKCRAGRDVTINIYHFCDTFNEARRLEYRLIAKHQPLANQALDREYPRNAKLVTIVAKRGEQEVGRYASIAEAAAATGVSRGAISSSITGRHPIVRGLRFGRQTET